MFTVSFPGNVLDNLANTFFGTAAKTVFHLFKEHFEKTEFSGTKLFVSFLGFSAETFGRVVKVAFYVWEEYFEEKISSEKLKILLPFSNFEWKSYRIIFPVFNTHQYYL